MPVAFLTAFYGCRCGGGRARQKVLVRLGTGGVGMAAASRWRVLVQRFSSRESRQVGLLQIRVWPLTISIYTDSRSLNQRYKAVFLRATEGSAVWT